MFFLVWGKNAETPFFTFALFSAYFLYKFHPTVKFSSLQIVVLMSFSIFFLPSSSLQ